LNPPFIVNSLISSIKSKNEYLDEAFNKEDWLKGLWLSGICWGIIDVQDEYVANRKKVMISNATQSSIEVYKEKQ